MAWELARDLKEGTYRPGAVRQVLIPKKQAGKGATAGHTMRSGPGSADGGVASVGRRSLKRTWNRSSTPIGRAEARKTQSSACIGC